MAERDAKFIIPDDQFFTRLVRPGGQTQVPTNKALAVEDTKPELPMPVKSENLPLEATERRVEVATAPAAQTASSSETADRKTVDLQATDLLKGATPLSETPARTTFPPKSENVLFVPPQSSSVSGLETLRPATPLRNGVHAEPSSTTTSPAVNGAARSERFVPREPRGSAVTNENKTQQPLRSMEPPAAPRGSNYPSRQSGPPGASFPGTRTSSLAPATDSRSQGSNAPKDIPEREANPSADTRPREGLSSRTMALPPRRLSPGRLPSSRSGSVDSKYSRASDSLRDAERRSDRRDRDRDRVREANRERDRDREKERDVDGRRDRDAERASGQDRELSQRSDRHRAADLEKDRRRDTRERDDRRDDRRDEKSRKDDRRDRDRDRERDRRERDRDRRDKERHRTSRREDEREKDKEKDKDKPRDRERGERTRDRDRDRERDRDGDDRERPRDAERKDRNGERNGDAPRDRPSVRGARDREDRESRDRTETVSSVLPPKERDETASADTRSSINALSARFDAQRRHSVTDSRGSAPITPAPQASLHFSSGVAPPISLCSSFLHKCSGLVSATGTDP